MGDHASGGCRLSEKLADTDLFPPRALDAEEVEAGRKLFARECGFVAGVADEAALPPGSLPEIAFVGRSNVGKSSLVNALTGRRMLARTSNTPGRTRQLNFFALDGRLMLVDLPGYGYAAASKSAIQGWTRLTQNYLRGRSSLRRVYLLIDSRHGLKPVDHDVMQMLDDAAVSYHVVLTKADKPKKTELEAVLRDLIDRGMPNGSPPIWSNASSSRIRPPATSSIDPAGPRRGSPGSV